MKKKLIWVDKRFKPNAPREDCGHAKSNNCGGRRLGCGKRKP